MRMEGISSIKETADPLHDTNLGSFNSLKRSVPACNSSMSRVPPILVGYVDSICNKADTQLPYVHAGSYRSGYASERMG